MRGFNTATHLLPGLKNKNNDQRAFMGGGRAVAKGQASRSRQLPCVTQAARGHECLADQYDKRLSYTVINAVYFTMLSELAQYWRHWSEL